MDIDWFTLPQVREPNLPTCTLQGGFPRFQIVHNGTFWCSNHSIPAANRAQRHFLVQTCARACEGEAFPDGGAQAALADDVHPIPLRSHTFRAQLRSPG